MADPTGPHSPRPLDAPPKPEPLPPAGDPATIAYGDAQTHPPDAAPALRFGAVPTQLPAQFGRYRLERVLGQGGMGAVYLAHDTQLDRRVALKVPTFAPGDADLRERFIREARAAATLHHPNVCPVFDVGEQDGVHYLTMAYIDGKSLSAYVRPDRPLPAAQAAGLVRVLAKALQEAHDHGIIHRDLKPANVMIGRRNQPVLMDFGLARRVSQDERLTHSGAVMGTPAYMPPEQVNGEVDRMGPGCDVYSLGVILYELLTGRRPFEGPLGVLMARIVMDPPPPPTQFRPDLDPALEAICLRALAKNPEDRHPSMRAFAAALEEWLAGKSPPPPPAPPTRTALPAPPPRPVALAAPPTVTAAPRRPPDEDEADAEEEDEPEPRRPARRRRGKGKDRDRPRPLSKLSENQKWFLLVSSIVLVTCVLPAGGVAFMIYRTAYKVSEDLSDAGKWFEKMQAEQKAQQEEQAAQQRQWEEAARTWTPPPPDVNPALLFPASVAAYRRVAKDGKADVPDLGIAAPGVRAVYDGPGGRVELFAYKANRLEKEAIFQSALDALTRRGGPPNFVPGGLTVTGSAKGAYLSYGLGPEAGAQPGRPGQPEQYGVLWWDRGWLFLARSPKPKEPAAFLKEYLAAVGRGPAPGPP